MDKSLERVTDCHVAIMMQEDTLMKATLRSEMQDKRYTHNCPYSGNKDSPLSRPFYFSISLLLRV